MKADIFYTSAPGRMAFNVIQKLGFIKLSAWFLHTRLSKFMIKRFIEKNGIDMTPFQGQEYRSFAGFFARKKKTGDFDREDSVLISPCDSLLSVYDVEDDMSIPMKGSVYTLKDLVTDPDKAELFRGGLCMVFRLQASDYHHFCFFDDGYMTETHYVPGQLHSVQPIACESVPVYRLNRRWWSIMDTLHFGKAAQIEVGAMAVGGLGLTMEKGSFRRGDEMGGFELAGSTIVVLLQEPVRRRLRLYPRYMPACGGQAEVRACMGQGIGRLMKENDR